MFLRRYRIANWNVPCQSAIRMASLQDIDWWINGKMLHVNHGELAYEHNKFGQFLRDISGAYQKALSLQVLQARKCNRLERFTDSQVPLKALLCSTFVAEDIAVKLFVGTFKLWHI